MSCELLVSAHSKGLADGFCLRVCLTKGDDAGRTNPEVFRRTLCGDMMSRAQGSCQNININYSIVSLLVNNYFKWLVLCGIVGGVLRWNVESQKPAHFKTEACGARTLPRGLPQARSPTSRIRLPRSTGSSNIVVKWKPSMTLDLYRDDLNRPSGAELYSGIESFCRISEPIDKRPQEGYLLDFKQEWGEKSLRTVASFANTFGGVLLVGISEENAKPKDIVGIQSNSEIKTQIASSIASNVSPTPPYDIAECSLPNEPTKRLCIVRVRKGVQLHFLTKKSEQPVYVRNADESRPAQAAELRALMERRAGSTTSACDLQDRLKEWQTQPLFIRGGGIHADPAQPAMTRMASPTFFRILVLPLERQAVIFDQVLEAKFREIIDRQYPGITRLIPMNADVNINYDRGRNWYEWQWLHKGLDYERRWRVNARVEFGFVTQTKFTMREGGSFWSLCDVAFAIINTLLAVRSFWEAANYFGDGRLTAELCLGELNLHKLDRYPWGFGPLFYSRGKWPDQWPMTPSNFREYPFCESDVSLPLDTVSLSDLKTDGSAKAEADVDYASFGLELPNIVTLTLNQLDRSLKHSVNFNRLREEIAHLVDGIV